MWVYETLNLFISERRHRITIMVDNLITHYETAETIITKADKILFSYEIHIKVKTTDLYSETLEPTQKFLSR